jgi:hypothetical protein
MLPLPVDLIEHLRNGIYPTAETVLLRLMFHAHELDGPIDARSLFSYLSEV